MSDRISRLHAVLETAGRRPGEFSISDRFAPSVGERQTLEARAAELDDKNQPATEQEIGTWVTRLFDGLVHPAADLEEAKRVVRAYGVVLQGQPLWALRAAVLRYLGNKVERPDRRFVPSSAELCAEVDRAAAPFRAERARLAAILSADVYREPTPEERERVHAGMKALLDEMRGAGTIVGEAREPGAALPPAAE